jgi:transposase
MGKPFVDYAGQTIPITDPVSGQTKEARLFVATLDASRYTLAWAAFSEQSGRVGDLYTIR